MGKPSLAMEREVTAIRKIVEVAAGENREQTLREKLAVDHHFGTVMHLLAGRIYHLTRTYGLMDMPDDARQVCAIGIHRAIAAYDPAQARFTTFVTWQLRGELQSLRHRVRLDQRDSAKKVGARTVSIELKVSGGEGSAYTIIDEGALIRAEAGASRFMASRCANALLNEWEQAMQDRDGGKSGAGLTAKLIAERRIVSNFLFENTKPDIARNLTIEQERQITRRILRHCAAQAIAAAA